MSEATIAAAAAVPTLPPTVRTIALTLVASPVWVDELTVPLRDLVEALLGGDPGRDS